MAGFAGRTSELMDGFRTAPTLVARWAACEPDSHEEDDAMRFSRWLAWGLLAALLVTFAWPAAASAQTATPEEAWDVVFSGVVVLRVRFGIDDLTPLQRQHRIYQNLREAVDRLGADLSPDLVQVTEADGEVYLQLGPYVITVVDEAHARYQRSTRQGLAAIWAANLRRAIERYIEVHSNI